MVSEPTSHKDYEFEFYPPSFEMKYLAPYLKRSHTLHLHFYSISSQVRMHISKYNISSSFNHQLNFLIEVSLKSYNSYLMLGLNDNASGIKKLVIQYSKFPIK